MSAPQNNLKYYSLFCGVFLFDEILNHKAVQADWLARLKYGSNFIDYLKKTYYENYLSNIVFGIKHSTCSSLVDNPKRATIKLADSAITIVISYIDIYLFQDGIGVFSVKVEFDDAEIVNYKKISEVLYNFRNPYFKLITTDKDVLVIDFIKEHLSDSVKLKSNWNAYIPQLKSYNIIEDLNESQFNESLDSILFGLSHTMPVDSHDKVIHSHSHEYTDIIFKQNTISIFMNWKAIPLFDSFTRISCSFHDQFQSWENDYFLIYVHCLYTKFQLYNFNSQLKDVSKIDYRTSKLRKGFIEFVNDYNLAYISYKFLPNHLYEKINDSLEIQKEIDKMELKIGRLHDAYQERKSKQTNQILLTLSLLSILSVLTDLSQWFENVGFPKEIIYSKVVVTVILISIASFAILLFLKNRR